MTLIGIAKGQGQFSQRPIRSSQFLASPFRAQVADIIADGATVASAEGAREMSRMHANRLGDVAQSEIFAEPVVQEFAHGAQPARGFCSAAQGMPIDAGQ